MKLVITGGCGFLGSNLAAAALARGCQVVVFDNLSRHGSDRNLAWLRSQGEVTFVHGDIRQPEDVFQLIRQHRPDVVFHVAGQVAMTTSLAQPRHDFLVNAYGTLNVLTAVRECCPQAIVVYSSTNKVYGQLLSYTYIETPTRWTVQERPLGFAEDTPLQFESPYGCSKGAADQYMLDWHRMYGVRTVVFRHSSMYGGRQYATYDQGWIGWFCAQALRQAQGDPTPFTISGDGKQVRDALHADDMVSLYFAAIEHIEQAAGQAFNIGGGVENSLSLLELFERLERRLGIRLRWTRLPPRASDQRVFIADIRKAQRLLQWTPRVDVETGLDRMLAWVRACDR